MIRLTELRNKLILRGVIYALIIGALIGGYITLVSFKDEIDQKHKWLKNDISSLRGKINNLDAQKVEFANAVNIWKSFTEAQKEPKGVQITRAEQVLTELYTEFTLGSVSTTFSKPALLEVEGMQKDNFQVEVSDKNTMSFSVYSDIQVYQFINALQTRFPGYVKITDLRMERVEKPSRTSLQQISNGEVPALVKVNIGFTWYALKSIENTEEQSQEQPS